MDFIPGLAKAIFDKHSDYLISKLTGFVKDEWEKFKIDSDIAFMKYLENSYEKHSKIKTILYRTEPKFIYNFFEYPNLIKKNNETIDSRDIDNLLNVSKFLIVQGTGGIGKSTFMKHLFINELTKNDLIPIFIELKDLNEEENEYDICDYIFKNLYNLGCDFNKNYLEYALKSGCFLFLLDGYDEIVADKKSAFLKKITAFCDRYSENYFIISSRPYSEFVEFQRFSILTLCKFTKNQSISLISKIDYDTAVKESFIKKLDENLYDKHTSFASNPLLLNIMLLTYDNYAEIPEKLHLFYSNAFETLYSKHDATKGGYKRELKSKLSFDSFKKVFSYFCFVTYYHGKIEFSYDELYSYFYKVRLKDIDFNVASIIDDLVNCICVIYKDGLNYRFAHRSFQEYFTSVFLKELPDTNMSKMAMELINKDPYRAKHDSVFDMLYDICPERVEQNIFLPLLKEIEKDCTVDKYYFYFSKLEITFKFSTIENEDNIVLLLRSDTGCKLAQFIEKFILRYRDNFKSEELEREESNNLLKYLVNEKGYEIESEINYLECIEDEIEYNLIQNTWIGDVVNSIANLQNKLSDKQKENEIDLSELLL